MTRREVAEAEQKTLTTRLQISERLASVGMLAAGVAHEINNPLTFVFTNLDYLQRELPPDIPPDWATAINDAKAGADRVRRIVKDLKLFSRNDDAQLRPVSVVKVIESVLSLVMNDLRHRAQLVTSFESQALVLGDEGRLGQVFLNLLVNAIQALPDGRAGEHRIEVRVRDGNGTVTTEVSDTGPGIPPKILKRIFEPFFTTKGRGQGTGLGLSICQSIVAEYQGALHAESTVGKGSVFTVTLPTVAPAAASAPGPTTPTARRRARILVVDDEPMVVGAVLRLLKNDEVEGVTSVREAEARWQEGFRYDVVLCDVMMPDLNAVDLYERLRQAHPGAERQIIFMTGQAFSDSAREMLSRVENQCLNKPIELAELERALTIALQPAGVGAVSG